MRPILGMLAKAKSQTETMMVMTGLLMMVNFPALI